MLGSVIIYKENEFLTGVPAWVLREICLSWDFKGSMKHFPFLKSTCFGIFYLTVNLTNNEFMSYFMHCIAQCRQYGIIFYKIRCL